MAKNLDRLAAAIASRWRKHYRPEPCRVRDILRLMNGYRSQGCNLKEVRLSACRIIQLWCDMYTGSDGRIKDVHPAWADPWTFVAACSNPNGIITMFGRVRLRCSDTCVHGYVDWDQCPVCCH